MGLIHTGVFATKEEIEDLKRLALRGWKQGDIMIVTSVMEGIIKDQGTVDAKKACHELALAHGLPEIPGYYGITHDGEFIKV